MLAHDLLMLLHHPETGRPLISSSKADLVIAGAFLAELTQRGRIEFTEPHRLTKNRTIVVTDPTPTDDDALDQALQHISAHRSTRAHAIVSKIAKGASNRILERFSTQGTLRSAQARLVGIIPARVWPAADAQHTAELQLGLHQVLTGERQPTPREAAAIALLHAIGGTAKVLGDTGLEHRELKRRAKAIAAGDAAGEAVRQALDAAAF